MKTVKDYLELGLVFVSGDKICGVTGVSSSEELDLFGGKLCEKKSSKGAVKIGVDCYARARWTPSSFAWRNNDGVKPEYKGLIDVCFEVGTVSHNESAIDFEWSLDDENYIAKWRPVVYMCNHTELKPRCSSDDSNGENDVSLKLPDIIYNPELIEEFKSLKGHLESKPPFWNKSMPIFNCPCAAVNIEAIKPAVSLKEDKPMKPVYTAEMHDKCELPPVGSEVALRYKFDSKQIHIIGKVLYASMEHCIIDGEHKECHYKMRDYTYEPIIKTIKVNGFDVPAPMSEAPEFGSTFYNPIVYMKSFANKSRWSGDDMEILWLSRGLVHSTESAAISHAKAMLGINPNPARGGDGHDRNVLGQNNEGDEL